MREPSRRQPGQVGGMSRSNAARTPEAWTAALDWHSTGTLPALAQSSTSAGPVPPGPRPLLHRLGWRVILRLVHRSTGPEPPEASARADRERSVVGVRGRWGLVAAVWLAVLGAVFMVAALLVLSRTLGWGYDFEAYYAAAVRLANGGSVYLPFTLEEPFRPGPYLLYLYAPPLAVALLPATALSLSVATWLWLGLRIVTLAAACALMPVSLTIRLATFTVACFSGAVLADLNLGNVSIVVTALTVLVWRWLDRPAGSVILALVLSVRPTMGLILFGWFLRRKWLPIAWTIAAGLLLIAATLPFVGLAGYLDFVLVLRHVSEVTGVPNNLDLGSAVLRLGLGPLAASIALFGGYLVALGAMLFARRRDAELGFVVTVGASLLLAPLLWDHYLSQLLIPAAFLAQRGRPLALLLPLLTWLPPPLLPLLVVAATLLPFLARGPGHLADTTGWRRAKGLRSEARSRETPTGALSAGQPGGRG